MRINGTYTCQLSIWNECDPYFVDHHGDGCDWYEEYTGCGGGAGSYSTTSYLGYASFTSSQGLKTGLVCPGCGCTAESGPISLFANDAARSNDRWIDAFGPSIEELRNNPKQDS